MTRTLGNILLAVMLGAGFLLMVEFTIINMILGCETWDKTYWTDTNSCLTLPQMLGLG